MLGVPGGEVAEVALAQQHTFRLPSGARRVQRHARRVLICSSRSFRQSHIHHTHRADIQRRKLRSGQWMRAIVQQQHRSRVLQDVLLTLHRLAGVKRQINRAAAKNRQDARVQLGRLGQADTDYGRRTGFCVRQ